MAKSGLADSDVRNDALTTAFTSAIGWYVVADPFWIHHKSAQIESALATQVPAAFIGRTPPKEALASAKTQMEGLTT